MTREEIISKIKLLFENRITEKNGGLFWKDEIIIDVPNNIENMLNNLYSLEGCISIVKNTSATILIQNIDSHVFDETITNGNIEIKINDKITDDMCLKILSILPNENVRLFVPTIRIERLTEVTKKAINIFDLIRIALPGYSSITINNLNPENTIDYLQYVKSFIFNSSMLQNRNYLIVENIEKITKTIRPLIRRITREPIDVPYRRYTDEVVQYFIDGNSARVPKIKFLSFYNVLEFYFDKIYIDDKCLRIQELITSPKFNHNNLKHYIKILELLDIKKAKHLGKVNITESESLKLLIKKFINLDDFKQFLQRNTFYINNNAYKVENTKFSIEDSDENLTNKICNRIYKVRNALVHSKEGEDIRYIPIKDDIHILEEIELIKYLAQEVIISTSTLIK